MYIYWQETNTQAAFPYGSSIPIWNAAWVPLVPVYLKLVGLWNTTFKNLGHLGVS